jgi:hypothetical protein
MYRIVPFHKLKHGYNYYIQSSAVGIFYSYDEEKTYAIFCKKVKEDLYMLHLVRKDEAILIQSILPSIQQAMEQRSLSCVLKRITGDDTFSW